MQQSCPHCDDPDMSLLRLVLIGEILRADETRLGFLAPPEEPQTAIISTPARLHLLRPAGHE